MRVIVLFDLPTETLENKRDYRKFRKSLIDNGFIMMQESVYVRMVLNSSVEKSVINKIRKSKPERGLVQVLTVTEKQFSKIQFISGEVKTEVIDNDERLIII